MHSQGSKSLIFFPLFQITHFFWQKLIFSHFFKLLIFSSLAKTLFFLIFFWIFSQLPLCDIKKVFREERKKIYKLVANIPRHGG